MGRKKSDKEMIRSKPRTGLVSVAGRAVRFLLFGGTVFALLLSCISDIRKMEGGAGRAAAAEDSTETVRQVALTFDDGPHPVYTKKLLEGLEERNVTATFFVVGKNIPGNEALIEQMDRDGHLIGNHTYDHVKICDMSGSDACEQVEKTSSLIRGITGKDTEYVRPPFGAWNKSMECSFTMIPVLWSVDPKDWTTKNTEVIVQRVLGEVEDNDIILLHDYYDSSVDAALRIVDELLKRGYEFVTVDKLILA
ncbi:MAG: polysaccharide deacetylase family protein [Candidatus Choladocola sp.]|nr:polysaccharide deacetylase family protein [Candidatus Choladocola sp.]